jgi:hypothetical protein
VKPVQYHLWTVALGVCAKGVAGAGCVVAGPETSAILETANIVIARPLEAGSALNDDAVLARGAYLPAAGARGRAGAVVIGHAYLVGCTIVVAGVDSGIGGNTGSNLRGRHVGDSAIEERTNT